MKQAVPSVSCCLGPWYEQGIWKRMMKCLGSQCYSICHIKCSEQWWQGPAMRNDWTAFYCTGTIRACCVLCVVSGLSCINEAMAVTKECPSEGTGWKRVLAGACKKELSLTQRGWRNLRWKMIIWLKEKLKNKLIKCPPRAFQNKWTI